MGHLCYTNKQNQRQGINEKENFNIPIKYDNILNAYADSIKLKFSEGDKISNFGFEDEDEDEEGSVSYLSKINRKKDRMKFSQSLDLTSNNLFKFHFHKKSGEFSTMHKHNVNFLKNPFFKLFIESEGGNNTKKERIKMLEYIYEIPLLYSSKESTMNRNNNVTLSIRKICKKIGTQKNSKNNFFKKKMSKQQISKESNDLQISDFVSLTLLESGNENTVLFEGELYRYHPGFAVHYYKKFCQLTKKEFRYFNQGNPRLNENPVLSIPLMFIESVKQVDIEIPEEKLLKQKDNNSNFHIRNTFQFEIYIKEKYNVVKYQNNKLINFHKKNQKSIEMKSNYKDEKKITYRKRNIVSKHSAKKEHIYLTLNQESIFSKKDSSMFKQPQNSGFAFQKDGHLMRSPYKTKISESKEKSGTTFRTISGIEPSFEDNYHTWTKREYHWYESESKLLFITDSKNELKKWICVFSWLVNLNTK